MFKGLRRKLKITDLEWSWISYDIANSAYVLTVVTVLYPLLNSLVAENSGVDPYTRSAMFSFLVSGLSFLVALVSPFLGAMANYKGYKTKLLRFFILVGAFSGMALAIPTLAWIPLTIIYALSFFGFNGSSIFYDSFLVDICEDESRQDELSSYGFSFGYIGSMIPFTIAIIPYALQFTGLVKFNEIFNISEYEALRYCFSFAILIASIWWLVFSKPILTNVKQVYSIEKPAHPFKEAINNIISTGKDIKNYKNIFIFLIASVLYMDVTGGLIKTVNNIAPDLGISVVSMLIVIIIIQIVAFPCAIIYGNLAKKFGAKQMIYVGMLIYFLVILTAYFMTPSTTWLVYILGLLVGMAQGGIQAVSRSFFARLVPREKSNEFFGFFGIITRFTGIISPFLYGIYITITHDPNKSIFAFFVPLILGAIVFSFVKDEKANLVK